MSAWNRKLSKFRHLAHNCGLLAALIVSAFSSLFVPLEQSQAQLLIDIYSSQDNHTFFVFTGSATIARSGTIRTNGDSATSEDTFIGGFNVENHSFGTSTSSDLLYSSGDFSSWSGASVFINASIQNFKAGDYYLRHKTQALARYIVAHQKHGNNQNQNFHIRIHGAILPEPEEYALAFGLVALGFVFFHRYFHKKRKRSATS